MTHNRRKETWRNKKVCQSLRFQHNVCYCSRDLERLNYDWHMPLKSYCTTISNSDKSHILVTHIKMIVVMRCVSLQSLVVQISSSHHETVSSVWNQSWQKLTLTNLTCQVYMTVRFYTFVLSKCLYTVHSASLKTCGEICASLCLCERKNIEIKFKR